MSSALLIFCILLYFLVEAIHDYYVHEDFRTNSDLISRPRRAWHLASVVQAGIFLFVLLAYTVYGLQPDLSAGRICAIFLFTRAICLNNVRNLLDKKSFFYVEKENRIGGWVHWLADRLWIPAEILMVIFMLTLLTLIIIL